MKQAAPVKQRICATRGCGRLLSLGTVGDRCRTCYESQSFSAQQRAARGEQAIPEAPQVPRWIQEKQEQDQATVAMVEPEPTLPRAGEKSPPAIAEQRVESEAEPPSPPRMGRPPGSPIDPILVEYLSAGPRSKQEVAEEVGRHGFRISTAEYARERLGIRSSYDREQQAWVWSLGKEAPPVMVAQRDREKVTVERERVTITAAEGSTKTVALKGGGQVTVNVVADLFRLTAPDRELVLGLVDALNAFERGLPPPGFHHCACGHYQAVGDAVAETCASGGFCMVCGVDQLEKEPHKPGCAQAVLEEAGVGS